MIPASKQESVMFTIHSHQHSGKTCDGISRRHFLKPR